VYGCVLFLLCIFYVLLFNVYCLFLCNIVLFNGLLCIGGCLLCVDDCLCLCIFAYALFIEDYGLIVVYKV